MFCPKHRSRLHLHWNGVPVWFGSHKAFRYAVFVGLVCGLLCFYVLDISVFFFFFSIKFDNIQSIISVVQSR